MLLYILLLMRVRFCCVCFSFPVLSQEIGWKERLLDDIFCYFVSGGTMSEFHTPFSRLSDSKGAF